MLCFSAKPCDSGKVKDFKKGSSSIFCHCPSVKTYVSVNHLTPNGHYMGRTAQLTSRCCILYIYSTNIRTEYFKHAA